MAESPLPPSHAHVRMNEASSFLNLWFQKCVVACGRQGKQGVGCEGPLREEYCCCYFVQCIIMARFKLLYAFMRVDQLDERLLFHASLLQSIARA